MAQQIVTLPNLQLDTASKTPLYYQVYEGIRAAILMGQLVAHTRLPATRPLARELGVSRQTVTEAYAQLLSEGYIEGKIGSGTYVSHTLPDTVVQAGEAKAMAKEVLARSPSRRGKILGALPHGATPARGGPRAFRPGLPATDTFPFNVWSRLMSRHWRNAPSELLGYGEPAGYRLLREAIAAYLTTSRGVRCTPDQVIIVAGSQQGLDLAARVLLDPGDAVWFEDPGYVGARAAFIGAGAALAPVPIDTEGLNITYAIEQCPAARLAYITPSHQFPLGVTMSLARRLALIEWARQADAWLVEDDYDSEYRYTGRPLPALQGLDAENRTIYVGTLSKTLFPALRLGYLVVPPDLVDTFIAAKAAVDRHAPLAEQAVLAQFITDGEFARHVRRTRMLYAERQAVLVEAAQRELHGRLDIQPAESGMHLVGYLPEGADDQAASHLAASYGVDAVALSGFALLPQPRAGLVLGYAAYTPSDIRGGVRRLAQALQSMAAAALR